MIVFLGASFKGSVLKFLLSIGSFRAAPKKCAQKHKKVSFNRKKLDITDL